MIVSLNLDTTETNASKLRYLWSYPLLLMPGLAIINILQVYQPINTILNSWIFDGELIDKSMEFFISCDDSSKLEKLWRSKYNLRQSMLPSFISRELAQKVRIAQFLYCYFCSSLDTTYLVMFLKCFHFARFS